MYLGFLIDWIDLTQNENYKKKVYIFLDKFGGVILRKAISNVRHMFSKVPFR